MIQHLEGDCREVLPTLPARSVQSALTSPPYWKLRNYLRDDDAAKAVPYIVEELAKKGWSTPIIGDFHYNGHQLLKKYPETAKSLAKYRINPGNCSIGRKDDDNFRTMVEVAVEHQKPVRIGVNWGSLDQALLTKMMEDVLTTDTKENWAQKFRHLPAGPIRTMKEALDEPEVKRRGMLKTYQHSTAGEVPLIGSNYHFSDTPVDDTRPPPALGEHTDRVLGELAGLSAPEIAALREKKVVG